jgi:hypothetical protein
VATARRGAARLLARIPLSREHAEALGGSFCARRGRTRGKRSPRCGLAHLAPIWTKSDGVMSGGVVLGLKVV